MPSLPAALAAPLLALWPRPRARALPARALATGGRDSTQAAVRALALGVPLDGAVLCRTLGRYKMLVDPADRGHGPHLVLDGYWQWWVTAFLAGRIRRGWRVAEVGAAYGYFTLLMADLAGATGSLTVLEPHPGAVRLLRHNLELNGLAGRVGLQRAALAASVGPVALGIPSANPMAAATAGTAPSQPVPAITPDSLCEAPLDLLKLDVAACVEPLWPALAAAAARQPGMAMLLSFDPARCNDGAALLAAMGQGHALHRLDEDGRPRAVAAAELLAGGEVTLWLVRRR